MTNLEAHPDQMNPNIPSGDTVGLDAFNLMRGAAFMVIDEPDPRVWVVQNVERDHNFERVYVWAWDATNAADGFKSGLSSRRAFDLGFCTKVALVGLIVNPDPEHEDNNWGAN